MATILNIETSSKFCSVALTRDGNIEFHIEDTEGMNHAKALGPYVEQCMAELKRKELKLDAVAVSLGPGSYTGLRIGLSMAKGLCFALDVPLIGISTLKTLAVKAMFKHFDFTGEELLAPMIDARRMEVYTAIYDFALNEVMPPQPLIVDSDSYSEWLKKGKVAFMGNATEKCKDVIKGENVIWAGNYEPFAIDMLALSEKAFREGDFIDTAYSVPEYLKEYEAVVGKNKVLSDACGK